MDALERPLGAGRSTLANVLTAPTFSDAFGGVYRGKTVLVTGHTGFKGSWLCLWLQALGARVVGYALRPPTEPNLFALAGIGGLIDDIDGDIRDVSRLRSVVRDLRPACVFHLAAQPIVRRSYEEPVETFDINVIGTAAILDAVRDRGVVTPVLLVTSDKSYATSDWPFAHHENDRLGGHDPYSASKAAAELIIRSFCASYGAYPSSPLGMMATGRAGNVIGGGDWAADRLDPGLHPATGARKADPCTRALSHPPMAARPGAALRVPDSGGRLAAI